MSWVFDAVELTALVVVLFLLSPLIVVGALSDWIEEKARVDSYREE